MSWFLLCGLFAVFMVVLVLRTRRRTPVVSEPSCGRCGYCVRGIPGLTCPECGADLREVGIVTPGMRRGLGPVGWGIIWTLILPLPAFLFTEVLIRNVLPTFQTEHMERVIFCQTDYLNVILRARMEGSAFRVDRYRPNANIPMQKLTLSSESMGPRGIPLTVDLPSKAWRFTDRGGKLISHEDGFGPQAVADWLGNAGFDATDARIQARARDIVAAVDEMPAAQTKFTYLGQQSGGGHAITVHPTFIYTSASPGSGLVLLGFWIFIWLAGLWWIARRHRRETPGVVTPVAM